MKELEIRAAKALGCGIQEIQDKYGPRIINIPKILDDFIGGPACTIGVKWARHRVGYLQFTTSYDWAMLGVKELLEGEDDFRQKNGYGGPITEVIKTIYLKNNKYAWDDPLLIFTLTPEQITQAWVEVLEMKE